MSNCPNCGAMAEGAANFCVSCGSRMPLICSGCGADNHSESRFCHSCGSELATPAVTAAPPPSSVSCPRCTAVNDARTTFCYSCGLPLDEFGGVPGPTAKVAVAAEGTPAGFWIRLLAWFIDTVVLVMVQLALLAALPGTSIEAYYSDDAFWTRADGIMAIVGAFYYTVGVSVFSTTIGKRALGLYVIRRDGTRVSGLRAFGRHLASGVSALVLGVGYLMIAFSSDKRGLHDHISDTVVVKR